MSRPPIPALENLADQASFEQLREAMLTDIRNGYEIAPSTLCLYLGALTQQQLHELKGILIDAPAINAQERTYYELPDYGYLEALDFLAEYIVTRSGTQEPNTEDIRLKQTLSGLGM